MATSWRLIGLDAASDVLLTALELLGSAGRVDVGATISSTLPPDSGSLSALGDNDPDTFCGIAEATRQHPGFCLRWDLAADADVVGVRVAGNLLACTVQYLNAGRWQNAFRYVMGKPVDLVVGHVTAFFSLDQTLNDEFAGLRLSPVAGSESWAAGYPPYARAAAFNGSRPGFGARSLVSLGGGITAFGVGDFEIACRVFMGADSHDSYARLLESKQFGALGGWNLVRVENLNPPLIRFHLSDGTTLVEAVTTNLQWHYLEVRRRGGQLGMLIDGQVVSVVPSAHPFTAGDLAIGGNFAGGERIAANFNEVLVINGWSRPIESYTLPPETAPKWWQPDRLRTAKAAVQWGASSELAPPSVQALARDIAGCDIQYGGTGRIFGTTKTKATPSNLPTKARVVLLHQRSKLLVRETWSDPDTGDYSFDGLDLRQEFLALAEDAAGNFRAVAAQRLLPGGAP